MNYPTPLVSCSWLAEHLDNPHVAIVDCRFSLMDPGLGRKHYMLGHIPGAVYLDLNQNLSSPVKTHGGRHPLPNTEIFAKTLSSMGIISEKTFVVAYDDSRFAFASRLWWLLKYLGHDYVAVLDGGFPAWQAAGFSVTQDIPTKTLGQFIPHERLHMLVTMEDVKARSTQPNVVLIDSRSGERYRGEREPIDPVAGHIPGAENLFWKEVTDETGIAFPQDVQRSRWQPFMSADEIMVYCGSGVTACVNLLSLELAGITTGKLYAGSWSDWCSHSATF